MDNETVVRILSDAGIRPTSNRILVLRSIMGYGGPASLMDLENQLETLDKSSIFRVIVLLAERGVIHGMEDGRGVTRYELCHADHSGGDSDMHAHFFCRRCGKMVCFPSIPAPTPALPEGYTVSSVNYMIKGLCPDCSRHP